MKNRHRSNKPQPVSFLKAYPLLIRFKSRGKSLMTKREMIRDYIIKN